MVLIFVLVWVIVKLCLVIVKWFDGDILYMWLLSFLELVVGDYIDVV